jgi:hypothetical protein
MVLYAEEAFYLVKELNAISIYFEHRYDSLSHYLQNSNNQSNDDKD